MKTKITYLLLILPLMTFAQGPWNFNTAGSVEGFVAGSSGETAGGQISTLTQSGGDLKVDFGSKNPTISNPTAGIDADNTVNFIEIRLKNVSSQASYLRVGNNTGGNYVNQAITTGDTDYKTYIVDVTAWTGPSVGINLYFKKNTGTTSGGAYTPVAGEYMLIDYIKPLAYVATPEVNTYNFTTTAEGFDKLTRATAIPATESGKGTLKVTYVSGANNALAAVVGLNSTIAHVEGANKYAHVILKNTTTNNKFQLKGKVATLATAFSPIQTFTASDAGYTSYDFDLSTWDSGYQFPEFNFALLDTWSATATYAVGNIVISGNTYCKNTSGANSVSPAVPQTDFANWVVVNATGVANWYSTATYTINDIVISGNTYFKNLTGANSTSPETDVINWVIQDPKGATIWDSAATTYAIDAIVISSGIYYKNLTGVNTATVPKNDTTNWLSVGSAVAAPAVGNALDMTNSIYIDAIVFDNTAPNLGTNDVEFANNTISLYPNPTQEVLNVNSADQIAKMEVYDMLGKKVASNNNAKNVNVAALGKGVYIVKVVKENGSIIAKRFIKQ